MILNRVVLRNFQRVHQWTGVDRVFLTSASFFAFHAPCYSLMSQPYAHCFSLHLVHIFHLVSRYSSYRLFFFFNDTATTEIYTLSLHDALPISSCRSLSMTRAARAASRGGSPVRYRTTSLVSSRAVIRGPAGPSPPRHHRRRSISDGRSAPARSEEHTSELQSQSNLVCRLLLEK